MAGRTRLAAFSAVALTTALAALAACSSPEPGSGADVGRDESVQSAGATSVTVPTWGEPERLSADRLSLDDSSGIVVVRGSHAMAAWNAGPRVKVAWRNEQGTWSRGEKLARGAIVDLTLGAHGSAAVIYRTGGYDGPLVERHRFEGSWSRAHRLGRSTGSAAAVIDRQNVITTGWPTEKGLVVVRRHPGRGWSSAERLDRRPLGLSGVDMDVNRRGDVVIAWAAGKGPRVAVSVNGKPLRVSTVIPSATGFYPDPQVEVDAQGRALLIWGRWSEAENAGRRHIAYATSEDGVTWTSASYLDVRPRGDRVWGTDSLSLSDYRGGRAAASWLPYEDGSATSRPYVSRFDVADGWHGLTRLENPFASSLNLTPDGTAVIVESWLSPISYGLRRVTWGYQRPGDRWHLDGVRVRHGISSSLDSRSASVLYYTREGVFVRDLVIPPEW